MIAEAAQDSKNWKEKLAVVRTAVSRRSSQVGALLYLELRKDLSLSVESALLRLPALLDSGC